MTTATFTITAIPSADLDRVRARGRDDFGNPVEVFVNQDDDGGTPLRCCLREAVPGEAVALIAYQPSHPGGPYAEVGPVFIHAEPCGGYAKANEYPQGFGGRRQLFRAYGSVGRQVHNVIVEPADVESTIADLLARPDTEFIHSRNVLAGCFMFVISRAQSDVDSNGLPRVRSGDRIRIER